MSFIKKKIINGREYFSLVTKVRRPNGTYGIKTIQSYGTKDPRLETKKEEIKDIRLTEKPKETKESIWTSKVNRWRKYLETKR